MFYRWYGGFIRWKRVTEVDQLENFICSVDYMLNTKRKRHITGGILLSISMLLGGLALTVMTIKNGECNNEQ